MYKFLFFFLFSCSVAHAQTTNSFNELIVQVPDLTEWKVYKISKQLSCLDGLRYLGYFKDGSCLLFHVDSKKIADTNIIITTIHHLNEKMKTDVIKGFSIYEVLDDKLPRAKQTIKK